MDMKIARIFSIVTSDRHRGCPVSKIESLKAQKYDKNPPVIGFGTLESPPGPFVQQTLACVSSAKSKCSSCTGVARFYDAHYQSQPPTYAWIFLLSLFEAGVKTFFSMVEFNNTKQQLPEAQKSIHGLLHSYLLLICYIPHPETPDYAHQTRYRAY